MEWSSPEKAKVIFLVALAQSQLTQEFLAFGDKDPNVLTNQRIGLIHETGSFRFHSILSFYWWFFFFLNIYFKNIFNVYLFSGTFQFGILDTSAIQTIGLATTIKSSYLKCKIQNSAMRWVLHFVRNQYL